MEIVRKRTINLFCPALSKSVPFVAWEEQRLDLGSIARAFELHPATLKLNGHFLSRGIDFIASSITWKSLLLFFSSRGLSTGTSDADALIVDGKLCKIGTKRSHDPASEDNGIMRPLVEEKNLFKKKRTTEGNTGFNGQNNKIIEHVGIGQKRKPSFDDVSASKSIKIIGTSSPGSQMGESTFSRTNSNVHSRCSLFNKNMKRLGDEIVISTPCKRNK